MFPGQVSSIAASSEVSEVVQLKFLNYLLTQKSLNSDLITFAYLKRKQIYTTARIRVNLSMFRLFCKDYGVVFAFEK